MNNSKKLSLFRNRNWGSIGFTDISANSTRILSDIEMRGVLPYNSAALDCRSDMCPIVGRSTDKCFPSKELKGVHQDCICTGIDAVTKELTQAKCTEGISKDTIK